MIPLRLPKASAPIVGPNGIPTNEFRTFLENLSASSVSTDLQAQIDQILALLADIDADAFLPVTTQVKGLNSIQVIGTLESGLVQIQLQGDATFPDPSNYYGTDADGQRGFFPAPDSAVPYLIPEEETYTVALNKQALFTMPIDVEGTLVVDGFLIEVA